MQVLTRKLLRDLWRIRSQAAAIALVVAAGVALYVLLLSAYASLELTQSTYYAQYRFADIFASARRAPLSLAAEIAALPGVAAAEPRVVADVTLDLQGRPEPISGRLISLPEGREPAVNGVALTAGRLPDPVRGDEVVAGKGFAEANGLSPGDAIGALINGRRRTLRIVGLGLSPEYVYVLRPGELVPDDSRFGVLWMGRRALGAAFQMEGGFNDIVLTLTADTAPEGVIDRVDRLLEPYGGLGAIPRAQQASHFFLQNELDQLQGMGRVVPVVFLAVAAFLIGVVLTRLVAVEREQIAAMKAIGYSNAEVGWHYLNWGLVVGILGAVIGVAAGGWLGRAMTQLYASFFTFPILEYRLPPDVMLEGVAAALGAALVGTVTAVRRVVTLPPAEAMRPDAPARYRVSLIERIGLRAWLSQPARMALRNLQRRPGRALLSTLAIGVSVALLVIGLFTLDSVGLVLTRQFYESQRYDAMVTFVRPVSASALFDVTRLPAVRHAESFRAVPIRLRAGPRERYLSIVGANNASGLSRILDDDGRVIEIPPEGLVLSRKLGELLDVEAGDRVRLEVLEGARPTLEVPVSQLVDDFMGLNAYMDQQALHRLMGEGPLLSGAYLTIDANRLDALYAALQATPAVAGVAVKRETLESFEEVMEQNLGTTRTVNVIFAAIIAFGVVYNIARVALSERGRELATLRVIGFTRHEIAGVLFGEWAIITGLALPLGCVVGYGLAAVMVQAFSTEVFRLPLVISPRTYITAIGTVLLATVASALVVRRRLDHLDLIAVLKTRE